MTQVAASLTTERLVLDQPLAAGLGVYAAYRASERSRYVGGPFDAAENVVAPQRVCWIAL